MGQYHLPILLKKNWRCSKQPVVLTLHPHEFMEGLKLMEHSYVGNHFLRSVMYMLERYGNGLHFVWCGDYADDIKTNYYKDGVNLYEKADELMEDCSDGNDYYRHVKDNIPSLGLCEYKYIINKSKKEYAIVTEHNENECIIHPLPLLCSNSNGMGFGDYHTNGEDDAKYVGRWAYDIVTVSNNVEDIMGFKKISPNFYEK